jgi:hypothetical protein
MVDGENDTPLVAAYLAATADESDEVAAERVGARRCHRGQDVEDGRRSSARIEDVRTVQMVFKRGVGYDSAKLIASVRGKVGLF